MGKVKIIVFGGPFSSGKTTILLKTLESLSKKGIKTGVLMNDVGPVDYKLVASLTKCPVEEVSRHCMCLKTKDLREALTNLLSSDHEVLLIEEIGFGNPHRCWTTLSEMLPRINRETELSAITVLVDGESVLRQFQGFVSSLPPVTVQQLSEADVVVINKADLLSENSLNALNDIVAKVNDHAKIFHTSALTGKGVEPLVEHLLESKWSGGTQKSTGDTLERRTQWFSDMVWSAYKVEFTLAAATPVRDAVGRILTNLGEQILDKGGEIVRIKAYALGQAEKVYVSMNPDLKLDYRLTPDSDWSIEGGTYIMSCVVKGIEVGDISSALKLAVSAASSTFSISRA